MNDQAGSNILTYFSSSQSSGNTGYYIRKNGLVQSK